jgi:hypothetical protein
MLETKYAGVSFVMLTFSKKCVRNGIATVWGASLRPLFEAVKLSKKD